MSTPVIIRKSHPNDLSYLSNSVEKLVEHTKLTARDAYFLELEVNYEAEFESWLREFMDDDSVFMLIAEVEGRPAGSIIAKETVPFLPISKIKRVGEIMMCWVEPEYRNKGVATELVSAVEKWSKSLGLVHIELNFIVGNTEAEAVWERLGYKPFRITSRKTLK